jgi:hypothetical protein
MEEKVRKNKLWAQHKVVVEAVIKGAANLTNENYYKKEVEKMAIILDAHKSRCMASLRAFRLAE